MTAALTGVRLWVVGRGGLLGSHVEKHARDSGAAIFAPAEGFRWDGPDVARELSAGAAAFAAQVGPGDRWAVLWCAGAGIVGTGAEALCAETKSLKALVDALAQTTREGGLPRRGVLFVASSAGGVYGGVGASLLTETSECRPISEYGRAKLEQEQHMIRAGESAGLSVLVGRVSNLYGPRQNLRKRQGLLSQISRHVIHRAPINLYVPLDTIRDYIHADDCAARVVLGVQVLSEAGAPRRLTQLMASEVPTSIAAVIGVYRKVLRTAPLVICSGDPLKVLQPRVLRFHSEAAPFSPKRAIDLTVGVSQLPAYQLRLYQEGRMPAPSAR